MGPALPSTQLDFTKKLSNVIFHGCLLLYVYYYKKQQKKNSKFN